MACLRGSVSRAGGGTRELASSSCVGLALAGVLDGSVESWWRVASRVAAICKCELGQDVGIKRNYRLSPRVIACFSCPALSCAIVPRFCAAQIFCGGAEVIDSAMTARDLISASVRVAVQVSNPGSCAPEYAVPASLDRFRGQRASSVAAAGAFATAPRTVDSSGDVAGGPGSGGSEFVQQ